MFAKVLRTRLKAEENGAKPGLAGEVKSGKFHRESGTTGNPWEGLQMQLTRKAFA